MVAILLLLLHPSQRFWDQQKDFVNQATDLGFKLVTIFIINPILIFLMMLRMTYVNLGQGLGVC
jgi:hypothetical protein